MFLVMTMYTKSKGATVLCELHVSVNCMYICIQLVRYIIIVHVLLPWLECTC